MLTGSSLEKLDTCQPALQRLIKAVAEEIPLQVICGYRGQAEQDKAFAEKKSKLKFPQSKHNTTPSNAVDIAPLKIVDGKRIIDWNDIELFKAMLEIVKKHAHKFGINSG